SGDQFSCSRQKRYKQTIQEIAVKRGCLKSIFVIFKMQNFWNPNGWHCYSFCWCFQRCRHHPKEGDQHRQRTCTKQHIHNSFMENVCCRICFFNTDRICGCFFLSNNGFFNFFFHLPVFLLLIVDKLFVVGELEQGHQQNDQEQYDPCSSSDTVLIYCIELFINIVDNSQSRFRRS